MLVVLIWLVFLAQKSDSVPICHLWSWGPIRDVAPTVRRQFEAVSLRQSFSHQLKLHRLGGGAWAECSFVWILVSGRVSTIRASQMAERGIEFALRTPSEDADAGRARGAQDEIVRSRRKLFCAFKRKGCGVVAGG